MEGYPNKRYYNGCKHIDELESYGIDLVTNLYDCNFANIQPHWCKPIYLADLCYFLKPDDVILGMDLSSGGHLSHGSPAILVVNGLIITFGVNEDGFLDYDEIQKLLKTTTKDDCQCLHIQDK